MDIGELVSEQSLLTTSVALDPIYLVFDMSESDYLAYQRAVAGRHPALDPGATRRRSMPTSSMRRDWVHRGTMDFVDNVVDQGTGTIRGRAIFPNPELLDHARAVRPHPPPRIAGI